MSNNKDNYRWLSLLFSLGILIIGAFAVAHAIFIPEPIDTINRPDLYNNFHNPTTFMDIVGITILILGVTYQAVYWIVFYKDGGFKWAVNGLGILAILVGFSIIYMFN